MGHEEEYTPKYCFQLEAAYGKGLMSEGAEEGIEHMFTSIPLQCKKALDIGSGLGGVAFYLADKHAMQITGLDVNAWMIDEAKKRIPEHLKDKVDFLLGYSNNNWPFSPVSYDIIYSKGVLAHLETKEEVFQECHRLLKKEGVLVIVDWLSSENRKWGKHMLKLIEIDHLTIFPENEKGYIEQLKKNGFTLVSVRDDSVVYRKYNRDIVERLSDPAKREQLLKVFSQNELEDNITGYLAIEKALAEGELRVLRFIAKRE